MVYNFVFQLRAVQPAIEGCRARNWKPFGPQLKNEVYNDV